jgi:hypothetical protein
MLKKKEIRYHSLYEQPSDIRSVYYISFTRRSIPLAITNDLSCMTIESCSIG